MKIKTNRKTTTITFNNVEAAVALGWLAEGAMGEAVKHSTAVCGCLVARYIREARQYHESSNRQNMMHFAIWYSDQIEAIRAAIASDSWPTYDHNGEKMWAEEIEDAIR